MSGQGKGPGKESDKVRILVGVLGTLRGGYDCLQRAGSVLCGSETEQSWAERGFHGSPQATFLVAPSSPVGPVVGVHLLAIPDLVATSLEP